jgi:hypothetical protein
MFKIKTLLTKHQDLANGLLPYMEELDVTLLGDNFTACRAKEKSWSRKTPTYAGSRGWLWAQKKMLYIGIDIDLRGDGHAKGVGISEADMAEAQRVLSTVPYVELRRSTSGQGLHARAWLDLNTSPTVETSKQIGPLGKQLWEKICQDTGSELLARKNTPDKLGCNLWFASRNAGENGFELLSAQKHLLDWATVVPADLDPTEIVQDWESDGFTRVPLDADHKLHIATIRGAVWDSSLHMLRAHTVEWAALHKHLNLRGVFATNSPGRNTSHPNSFAFPLRDGAWIVYAWAGSEAPTWSHKDAKPFTYFNKVLTLDEASRMYGASMRASTYSFPEAKSIADMALHFPGTTLPTLTPEAPARIKVNGTRLTLGTKPVASKPWEYTPLRIVGLGKDANPVDELGPLVRCLHNEDDDPLGWAVYIADAQRWVGKNVGSIDACLQALGAPPKSKGPLEMKPWTLVSRPFEPEYPDGLRLWNCKSAQLKHAPIEHDDPDGRHPLWNMLLNHFAGSLDKPLKELGNTLLPDGRTYIMAWFAYIIRNPRQRLPYLFAHGSQDCGKSTVPEAFERTILDGGVCSGERAVKSEFNAQLDGSVLVVCDDVRFSDKDAQALKDLVTAPKLKIRRMRCDEFQVTNYTHWVHLGNNLDDCPQFPGDRRIVDFAVPALASRLNKEQLMQNLDKEGPYFTYTLLNMQLSNEGRLGLPLVETESKQLIMEANVSDSLRFLREETIPSKDSEIRLTDLIKGAHRFGYVLDRGDLVRACGEHGLTVVSNSAKVQFVKGIKL